MLRVPVHKETYRQYSRLLHPAQRFEAALPRCVLKALEVVLPVVCNQTTFQRHVCQLGGRLDAHRTRTPDKINNLFQDLLYKQWQLVVDKIIRFH
jgi:hypothetical protein